MNNRIKRLLQKLKANRIGTVYYIGGSDVLPPPLKGEQENQALEELEQVPGMNKKAAESRRIHMEMIQRLCLLVLAPPKKQKHN